MQYSKTTGCFRFSGLCHTQLEQNGASMVEAIWRCDQHLYMVPLTSTFQLMAKFVSKVESSWTYLLDRWSEATRTDRANIATNVLNKPLIQLAHHYHMIYYHTSISKSSTSCHWIIDYFVHFTGQSCYEDWLSQWVDRHFSNLSAVYKCVYASIFCIHIVSFYDLNRFFPPQYSEYGK